MDKKSQDQILLILQRCINNSIKRLKKDKTFRPFHEALLTKELITASAFERSFSTSFGQGPIEEISKILAETTGAICERQKETMVNINKGAVEEIERITSSLRNGTSQPNWKKEVSVVTAFQRGDFLVRRVISDLWFKRDNIETFISIKTVKPNIDQSEIVKKDMLLLKAHNINFETFFGLYYNPGGDKRTDYNWSMPSRIFDMKHDECILIGKEYWDHIGGKGTYIALLKLFEIVGEKTRKQLKDLTSQL